LDFLKKVRNGYKKPIVAVITGGSPLNLQEVHELADAVILAWYPGEEGGNAAADLIFGKVSPSGKLPVTFPKSLDQLPTFNDYGMKGRTYRYMAAEPMYPFGYGLSYGNFVYTDLKIATPNLKSSQSTEVKARVTNNGKMEADEVVQLYLSAQDIKEFEAPLLSLKGFKRIHLKPGESAEVSFSITPELLTLYNNEGVGNVPKGKVKVFIGGSSPIKRSTDLGAAKPAEGLITIK
jgi:beta-glucosidase